MDKIEGFHKKQCESPRNKIDQRFFLRLINNFPSKYTHQMHFNWVNASAVEHFWNADGHGQCDAFLSTLKHWITILWTRTHTQHTWYTRTYADNRDGSPELLVTIQCISIESKPVFVDRDDECFVWIDKSPKKKFSFDSRKNRENKNHLHILWISIILFGHSDDELWFGKH